MTLISNSFIKKSEQDTVADVFNYKVDYMSRFLNWIGSFFIPKTEEKTILKGKTREEGATTKNKAEEVTPYKISKRQNVVQQTIEQEGINVSKNDKLLSTKPKYYKRKYYKKKKRPDSKSRKQDV